MLLLLKRKRLKLFKVGLGGEGEEALEKFIQKAATSQNELSYINRTCDFPCSPVLGYIYVNVDG